MANKKQNYDNMSPDDLQAMREQADRVGLRDSEIGKFLRLFIPHFAHLHGLDPDEEDQRLRDEAAAKEEELRNAAASHVDENALTPAQKESKAQAEAQGKQWVPPGPGEDSTLDPVAKDTQASGATTVPSAQLAEQVPATNELPPQISTIPNFSSSGSNPEQKAQDKEGKK